MQNIQYVAFRVILELVKHWFMRVNEYYKATLLVDSSNYPNVRPEAFRKWQRFEAISYKLGWWCFYVIPITFFIAGNIAEALAPKILLIIPTTFLAYVISIVIARMMRNSNSIEIRPTLHIKCGQLRFKDSQSYKCIARKKTLINFVLAWSSKQSFDIKLATTNSELFPVPETICFGENHIAYGIEVEIGDCSSVTDVTVTAILDGAPTSAVFSVYPA